MAKIVRTSDTDYRIIVGNSGTITLDTTNATNDGSGVVVVKGDLEVKGNTTTVESTITTIQDNIIVLSHVGDDDSREGLPASLDRPYSSGIEIDRGLFAPARWVYDDSITWALGGTTGLGTWVATQGNIGSEQRLPLATPGIIAGGDLYISTGSGVITVTGTTNYEEKIWNYEAGLITPDPITSLIVVDDDNIPNAKAVKDLIDYSVATVEIDKIQEDNSRIEVVDKNNIIAEIIEVGSRTTIRTAGTHGFVIGNSITISGVTTSPTDAIINDINGTWTVTGVPATNLIEFNKSTTGGDKDAYDTNSGSTVSSETRILVNVEDTEMANFYNNRIELDGIQIKNTELSTFSSNEDLVLTAPGTGSVKIKDVLEIPKTPYDDDAAIDPSAPVEGFKLYSKSPDTGKSGIYFVNENNYSDELISKNRALLFGMLF